MSVRNIKERSINFYKTKNLKLQGDMENDKGSVKSAGAIILFVIGLCLTLGSWSTIRLVGELDNKVDMQVFEEARRVDKDRMSRYEALQEKQFTALMKEQRELLTGLARFTAKLEYIEINNSNIVPKINPNH